MNLYEMTAVLRNTGISEAKTAFIRLAFPILQQRLQEYIQSGQAGDESMFVDTLLGFLGEMTRAMMQDRDSTLKNETVIGFFSSCLQTLTGISRTRV